MAGSLIDRAIGDYYDKQLITGRGYSPVYKGQIFHRGSGWASGIAKLFKLAAPALKSTGKYLLKKGVHTASNFATDILDGANLKESARRQAGIAYDSIKHDLRDKIIKTVAPRQQRAPKRQRKPQRVLKNNKRRRKTKNQIDNFM